MSKILVYGFYNHNNIGDDLFIEAFCYLFPNNHFIFTDHINENDLQNIDAVFFGGGSFLDAPPNISAQALKIIEEKKIFYIGVGTETKIDDVHWSLMKKAKLIAPRTIIKLKELQQINSNVLFIPDLVYSLPVTEFTEKQPNSILVLPNISVVPKWNDEHWKHQAWEYYKSEFAQFLDHLIEQNYIINFFSMSQDNEADDSCAAIEIINKMKYRNKSFLIYNKNDFPSLINLFSKHDMIITQRYHGIILSYLSKTPFLIIHHHDKLKYGAKNDEQLISFYETSKNKLIDKFTHFKKTKYAELLIQTNIFNRLVQQVEKLLET